MKVLKFSLFENNEDYIRKEKISILKYNIRSMIETYLEEDEDVDLDNVVDVGLMMDEVLGDYLEDMTTNLFDKITEIKFEDWDLKSYTFQKYLCENHPNYITSWGDGVRPDIREEYDHLWTGKNVGLL